MLKGKDAKGKYKQQSLRIGLFFHVHVLLNNDYFVKSLQMKVENYKYVNLNASPPDYFYLFIPRFICISYILPL
jgi:hypothetical protein